MRNLLILILLGLIPSLLPKEVVAQRTLPKDKRDDLMNEQPDKKCFKFSKSKYRVNLNDYLIDTNSVYIYTFFNNEINATSHTFMRFFETGEVYMSFGYLTIPSIEELNSLDYGKWGMYTINKKGV